MYPFNDENYYMSTQNPYFQPIYQQNMYPVRRPISANLSLRRTLHLASRTISTINQIIPIINQVRPLIDNTRNGLAIIKAMHSIDDIDLDEVEASITPEEIVQDNHKKDDDSKVQFENML